MLHVDRIAGAGNGPGTERQRIGLMTREGQTFMVSLERDGVRKEEMCDEYGLGRSEMCERRHEGRLRLTRASGEGRHDLTCRTLQQRDAAPQVQPQIDRHLLVARAPGVQASPGIAESLDQLSLDEAVNVFVGSGNERRLPPAARKQIGKRRIERTGVFGLEHAGVLERARPRATAGHVVFEQTTVDAERRAPFEGGLVGRDVETTRPERRRIRRRHVWCLAAGVPLEAVDQRSSAPRVTGNDEDGVVTGDCADDIGQRGSIDGERQRLGLSGAGAHDNQLGHALDGTDELTGATLEGTQGRGGRDAVGSRSLIGTITRALQQTECLDVSGNGGLRGAEATSAELASKRLLVVDRLSVDELQNRSLSAGFHDVARRSDIVSIHESVSGSGTQTHVIFIVARKRDRVYLFFAMHTVAPADGSPETEPDGRLTPGAARVAVAGATGYAGQELLRILSRHPAVRLTLATSSSQASAARRMPGLERLWTGHLSPLDADALSREADVVFLALPDTTSASLAPTLLAAGVRVIDVSGAFRLRDDAARSHWYPETTTLPPHTAYGLTEWERGAVRTARLVANPGCYPTTSLLALLPLVKSGLLLPGTDIIVDAKSGVSGAGKNPTERTHFSEVHGSLSAYGVFAHRHGAEIEQGLGRQVTFTPHLVPLDRGIFATIYVRVAPGTTQDALGEAYERAYAGDIFVRLVGAALPEIKHVAHTNFCDIGWRVDPSGRAILVSVTDNLVKGAAGQAVQNMNVMLGFDERTGLL